MKIKYFLILMLFCFSKLKSQDFEKYQTLLSRGDMPDDFRLMATEKYRKELDAIKAEDNNKKIKKLKRNYALETSFAISDLMMSGRVIYGDELGVYVNKIADIILKDDKELREKLRFYILKSTAANALCTNQGIIFITSGLIAQVENEAQLAFIIAHEIIHYTKKHNFESYKKREAVLKGASRKSTVSVEEKVKSLYKYSKKNETEADELGLELFMKSAYNPYAALSSFDVLLYSYLPYDMIEWKPTVFETKYYKFPEKYTSNKLDEISADEDIDDEMLTHPNIGKRKSNINNFLREKSVDSIGKSLYLVSKNEFLKAQKIARYELASLYIKAGNPAMAYYIAYLLDKTYGANYYTDKIKSMCLYSLAHHSAFSYELDYYGCNDEYYEGEVQQVAKFFTKITPRELSVLAGKYIWEMSKKYPGDEQLKIMRSHIFTDIFDIYEIQVNNFLNYKPPMLDTLKANSSKVDKLKNKQTKKPNRYYNAAFYEFLGDTAFIAFMTDISNYLTQKTKSETINDDDDDEIVPENNNNNKRNSLNIFNKETSKRSEEINTIVMFNPEYSAVINHKVYPLNEEIMQEEIASFYKNMANDVGINLTMIDKAGEENYNTETFNKYALLRDWFIERVNNDTLTMELYQKEFIKDAFSNYQTKYLGWAGYKYSLFNREMDYTTCTVALVFYPFFPLYIAWQLSRDKKLESLMLVYDVNTGKPVLLNYTSNTKRPKKFILQAIIYNQLYDLKYGK